MSEQGVRTHHRRAAERLAHFSQWSGQHIKIGYAIVRVWRSRVPDSMAARILLGNPDEVEPDGSLHLTHTDGPPCDVRISHPKLCPVRHVRILWSDILHPNISQSDGRGGRFKFSGKTYPDPLIALTRRVSLSVYSATVFSWSFLIFPTDILRYFALDICCLNPQSLLVTHLS